MPIIKEKKGGAKPFLKWAGGKSQLLSQFEQLYPASLKEGKIKHYFEPFLGSGAVFLHIVQQYNIQSAWLYDVNPELVLTWKTVQKNPADLTERLYTIEKKYHKLNKKDQLAFFYKQREQYNKKRPSINHTRFSDEWIKRAAQLIFLNRTCFNGLYRVNSKGNFNTPAGRYNNPAICDAENLMAVSKLLSKAEIQHADFKQVLKNLKKNAFIYFDPPYRPLTSTALFNTYAKEAFSDTEQTVLAALFAQLDAKGEYVMLSNSDPKNANPRDNFFDKLYRSYHITRIPARRIINANATKRGPVNELVITNYPVK